MESNTKQGSATSGGSLAAKPLHPDPKKGQRVSIQFAGTYRAISKDLQKKNGDIQENNEDVQEIKDFLRYLVDPQSPDQLCVDPKLYEGATTTKEVLQCLLPQYINPTKLFILEGIVETFGSDQCKKYLDDYKTVVASICDDKKGERSDLCEHEQSKAAPPSSKRARISRSHSCEHWPPRLEEQSVITRLPAHQASYNKAGVNH